MTATRLIAPAKLTTSLSIVGVRPDGYHLIDAVMVSIDVVDDLVIEPAPVTSVQVTQADGSPHRVPAGPDNLVVRALAAAGVTASVDLLKRIPAGAGLGGGSSDAAAVLRWAGVDDPAVGAAIGADVPFCVIGGRARVRGIGEQVDPFPYVDQRFILVTPPFGCSTPEVYAAWDDLGGPDKDPGGNDLLAAAAHVEPRLLRWQRLIEDCTGQVPRLAGSGSTWFVEMSHLDPVGTVTDAALSLLRAEGATVRFARSMPAHAADAPSTGREQ